MNKKRLSVVMAGAMLASSVSPVLAADAEVNKVEIEKGLLIAELTEKIWNAPRFSDLNDGSVDSNLKNKSVYTIQIGKNAPNVNVSNATVIASNTPATLQAVLKTELANVVPGDVVKLVDLGHETVKKTVEGKEVDCVVSTTESTTYTASELVDDETVDGSVRKQLKDLNTANATELGYAIDYANSGYKTGKGFVVKLNAAVSEDVYGAEKELVLKEGMPRVDFSLYYADKDKKTRKEIKELANSTDFYGFVNAEPKHLDIATKDVTEYTVSTSGSVFKLSDLYDAPFLTEKGQTLLDFAKAAYNELSNIDGLTVAGTSLNQLTSATVKAQTVRFSKDSTPSIKTGTNAIEDLTDSSTGFEKVNGLYKARVEIVNPSKVKSRLAGATSWTPQADDYDVYYVTAESEKELVRVLKGIDQLSPAVDKLVGADRYATAVKIAKELRIVGGTKDEVKDIVLVNGNSLVDGLAAAPLANSLSATKKAPILLTETGKLPTATKKYLRELIDVEENKDVTVHIVGGTGVVSKSIERELKDLGLKVERLAGEDREGTSMAVAEKIADEVGYTNAFVVGATGEADAMSISGKAAELKTPIVVSGFNGLSEDTLEELDGKNITVLGGDASVSNAEYENIGAVAGSIKRIAGSDRKDTNAKIISTFYNNSFAGAAKSVLVAKDDVLVDALTASNLSAHQNAPIVLATNELTKAQLDAVVTNASASKKVYQIGGGVAPAVVKAVAKALDLI